MNSLVAMVVSFVLGGLGWTLAEYWIHYGLGHIPRGRHIFSREHLMHHAKPTYFSPNSKKAVSAIVVVSGIASIGYWLVGLLGFSFAAGFTVAYLVYEWVHRRAHTHPGTTRHGRTMRLHHFSHHFENPMRNHGFSFRLWDRVFGTFSPVEKVVVPRRMAMEWLLDENGEVKPEHRATYVLRGSAKPREEADHVAAFSNEAPSLSDEAFALNASQEGRKTGS